MRLSKSFTCAALALAIVSNGALADSAFPTAQTAFTHSAPSATSNTVALTDTFADAFSQDVSWGLQSLDAAAMEETRGEMLPLLAAVAGVAAADLALATFFWGVYVPFYASPRGGPCTTCDIPKPIPR